jgi:hypothetical protein
MYKKQLSNAQLKNNLIIVVDHQKYPTNEMTSKSHYFLFNYNTLLSICFRQEKINSVQEHNNIFNLLLHKGNTHLSTKCVFFLFVA